MKLRSLPAELVLAQEKIERHAREFGLTFFPVMFELTILFSAFTTLFGLLAMIQLPRLNHPLFASKQFHRATDDAFFICIEARDPKFSQEKTRELLTDAGGFNIELVEEDI